VGVSVSKIFTLAPALILLIYNSLILRRDAHLFFKRAESKEKESASLMSVLRSKAPDFPIAERLEVSGTARIEEVQCHVWGEFAEGS
jgi:hypothetical protein